MPPPAERLPDPTGVPREAIIFIPGLGQSRAEESAEIITRRFASALNDKKGAGAVRYLVGPEGGEEPYDARFAPAGVGTVVREEKGTVTHVLDLYRMPYAQTMTGDFEQRNLFTQCAFLFLVVIVSVPKLAHSFVKRSGLSTVQKFQVLLASVCLLLIALYAALVLIAAIQSAWELAGTTGPADGTTWQDKAPWWIRAFVVWLTAAAAFAPRLRQRLTASVVLLFSLVTYLNFGTKRLTLIGQLKCLLDYLRAKKAGDTRLYGRVHVVAYSTGSLIAVDSLFAPGNATENACRDIDTLVTIGCPFDMVRTYWPDYFKGRYATPGNPRHWVNVYSPLDILGSNFRDDEEPKEPTAHVSAVAVPEPGAPLAAVPVVLNPRPDDNIAYTVGESAKDLPLYEILTFIGFRSHSVYWDAVGESDFTCFGVVVPVMYDGAPAPPAGG